MKTGFLIINYNDFPSTEKLIENIKNYKVLDCILIVDNCSTDDSYEKLKKLKSKKIEVIKPKENKGYGAGINFGTKYLIQKFGECNIIVSNADIIIKQEEDIKELIDASKKKEIAVVAPTILEHGVKNRGWKLSSIWQEISFSIPYFYKKLERKYHYYPEQHYQKRSTEVDVVSGCFFLIKSKVLEQIGFFDENVFLYYEENIIAKKIKDIKKKEIILNGVEVIHNHSVTIDKSLKRYQKLKQLKRSQEYYVKTYQKTTVVSRMILILLNRLLLGLKFILQKWT